MASDGVYFRRDDYAGFWRRVAAAAIDLTVVGMACLVVIVLSAVVFPSSGLVLLAWAAVIFGYFVLLKRSRLSTLGYRITGVRIVGVDGYTASIWALSLRVMIGLSFPLWILDLIWLAEDSHGQALRDKLARTYVVRKNAESAGTGKVVSRYYDILGYSFLFQEVEPAGRDFSSSPPPSAATSSSGTNC